MIVIDGSQKSGSGTIVRDAVPFSVLMGKDLHLKNIRHKREKPGLRPQHLKAVQASVQISSGTLEGAEVGSMEIAFRPGQVIRGGRFTWDIGTAGSTTMLALSVIPLALFADGPSTYTITGGLFQDFAPSAFHLKHVLFPLLKRMGIELELEIIQPGYVPRGMGQIRVKAIPLEERLKPLVLLDQGNLSGIRGMALSSLLKGRRVSERMAGACLKELGRRGLEAEIEVSYDTREAPAYRRPSIQAGASLALWARTTTKCLIGSDMAGAPKRTAEFIGKETAKSLMDHLNAGATVDVHVADQLIPFSALAQGWSAYKVSRMTEHIESRLWLVEEILGAETEVSGNLVRVRGIGYLGERWTSQ